ncbi:exonuclease domain-containing protein [Parafrigoribacterium soli]|uniref:exonuclease domain-containing protein n=1 Tax=Parafrigoribacterium soli TaxID=3144663 RepID=UPI0032EDCEA8
MSGPGFAVIDFETTGLFPGGHDRVVEVAVVHLDGNGSVTGQWDTLVNPERDLGPQHIHRIKAADVLGAPTFTQIACELVDLLRGRVLVAHNASFDIRFLRAELERAGAIPPLALEPWLCTMQLARDFLPGAGRALADCCAAYDIELENAHRASVDALATAKLLAAYMGSETDPEFWYSYISQALDEVWPSLTHLGSPWVSRGAQAQASASFIQRITLKMPEHAGPVEHLDYLALLDRCLLDQQISVHEANALVNLAETLGISRTTCIALHRQYFDQLTAVAWADGVLTTDEIADLVAIARMLDVPSDVVVAAMQTRAAAEPPAESLPAAFRLQAGDQIVLTGDMMRSREDWQRELRERGFVPWDAVTKKVKLVAAADPDSLSGKARKARDYGIPIVDEVGLAAMLAH